MIKKLSVFKKQAKQSPVDAALADLTGTANPKGLDVVIRAFSHGGFSVGAYQGQQLLYGSNNADLAKAVVDVTRQISAESQTTQPAQQPAQPTQAPQTR